MNTRLSVKGQVVIPRKIREQLRLKEGMELSVEVEKDALILRKVKSRSWKEWKGALKKTEILKLLEREHEEETGKGE